MELKSFLDKKVEEYNRPSFIKEDPIAIPHLFSRKQDIEISGFFAALFAWGRRKTILDKMHALLNLMDDAPYDFIMNHEEVDLKRFLGFAHRTINDTDILFLISFFKRYYNNSSSLEDLFVQGMEESAQNIEGGLVNLRRHIFVGDYPKRTLKHVASPERGSACKRLNMFLRWMVRKDDKGVDFGIWEKIAPSQLIIPMDLHVSRVAQRLQLIDFNRSNWKNAVELTAVLKTLDREDPVKYDFALFGLGVLEGFS